MHSNSGYFLEIDRQSGIIFVHDKEGKIVFSTELTVISESYDILPVKDDDSKCGFVRADRSEIVPCSSDSFTKIGYDYHRASKDVMVGPYGIVAENLTGHDFLQRKDGMLLVLNTGEFALPAEGMYELGNGVAYGSKEGLYGLFDLFTGEQLLPYEYKQISCGLGFVYANKGNE